MGLVINKPILYHALCAKSTIEESSAIMSLDKEYEFWRKLSRIGHYIIQHSDGSYGCYFDQQLLKKVNKQIDDNALIEIMDWVRDNVFKSVCKKTRELTNFLVKAIFNRGFGVEFIDCAVIAARDPSDAQKAALEQANTYFKNKLPKYEPDDVCIRPIPPEELNKYEKLNKIQLTF